MFFGHGRYFTASENTRHRRPDEAARQILLTRGGGWKGIRVNLTSLVVIYANDDLLHLRFGQWKMPSSTPKSIFIEW